MKLSFSKKPSAAKQQQSTTRKPSSETFNTVEEQSSSPNKQYVTEFDTTKTLAADAQPKFVIPPIADEWKSFKKVKKLDLPDPSDDPNNNLQFEVDATNSTAEPTDSKISYGLNLREPSSKKEFSVEQRGDRSSIDSVMLQKLKNDLERLPEDGGIEEFNDMSVENFAKAMLAGYGWYEGRGIGRNAKEDIEPVEYKRRTGKEGLGFVDTSSKRKKEKKEEKEKGQGIGNAIANGNGVEQEGKERYYMGKTVRIVGGRHVGLKGTIVEVMGGGHSLVLKLSRSGEEVTVRARDVVDLGSKEEEKCLNDLKMRESKEEIGSGTNSRRRSKDKKDNERSKEGGQHIRESRGRHSLSWLNSHIRVRIISKELKGGRLYLQKGEVVDVVGPNTCDISMDNGRELVQGVAQELLETALPRCGGPVLVLYGKYKGVYGSLVEKHMENETAVVRNADTHALFNVRLEQIAEYVGDPSDIGY